MKKNGKRALSIRARYTLTMIMLFFAMLSAFTLIGVRNYRISYDERVMEARSDFDASARDLDAFIERISGLANIVQYNSSLVNLLSETENYTTEEYQLARNELIPMIYSLEDGSGDYTCRLYIRSSLPFLDITSHILPIRNIEDTDWAHSAMDGFGQWRWDSAEDIRGSSPAYLVPIRSLERKSELVALLRIDILAESFMERMECIRSGSYTGCVLLTDQGDVVASTGTAETDNAAGMDDHSLGAYGFNTTRSGADLVFYRRLEKTGWLLSMTVSHHLLREPLLRSILLMMGGAILLLLLGMLLGMPFLRNVVNRITRFHRHVLEYNDDAASGHLPEPLDPGAEDEVGQLIDAYNGMVDRIGQLMQEQEAQEEESRRLEISALQNQINPHFLYNTLDTVNWMSKMKQPDQVETIIRNLSDFYRLCLSSGQDVLTVEKEIEICRHYFSIMVLRNHKDYRLDIQVPEEMMTLMLPKITLQPLVENAMNHGLMESGQSSGTVWIRGQIKNGRRLLSVEDSGGHFSRDAWNRIMRKPENGQPLAGDSYGLRNVERRLCLFLRRTEVLRLAEETPERTVIEMDL